MDREVDEEKVSNHQDGVDKSGKNVVLLDGEAKTLTDEAIENPDSTSGRRIEACETVSEKIVRRSNIPEERARTHTSDDSREECSASKKHCTLTTEDIALPVTVSASCSDETKPSTSKEYRKRQKPDETTASTSNIDASKFHKLHSKVRKRNYRVKAIPTRIGENSNEPTSPESRVEQADDIVTAAGDDSSDSSMIERETVSQPDGVVSNVNLQMDNEASEANSDSYEDDEDRVENNSDEWSWASDDQLEEPLPLVLRKDKPKPDWFVIPEVINRQLGQNPLFNRKFYGSQRSVRCLELMNKLYEHKGCVNSLSFNRRGNLLASGSDDLTVIIWDWYQAKEYYTFTTGHRMNVFQAKWLPLSSENYMVTAARDGQVRLADLHVTATKFSRRLAVHDGAAKKLSIHPELPHVVLSVGEDAKVLSIDIREDKPNRILTVKERSSKIPLYSISSNPLNSNEFCLAGKDQFVRVYDKRKLDTCLNKLCPKHLKTQNNYAHITSAIYNYNGSEILASYNDEDIYLFDTQIPHPNGDFAHRYQGHRNSATVKGVSFFGPKSEYVMSGSDCGNIYVWDKNTEAILQWMAGDEHGIVNCLEPHPDIPVLATSGFDYDVKIWMPSSENTPVEKDLERCIKSNMRNRKQEVTRNPDEFDGQLIWYLWRRMTQTGMRGDVHTSERFDSPDTGDEESELAVASSSSSAASNASQSDSEDEPEGRTECNPS